MSDDSKIWLVIAGLGLVLYLWWKKITTPATAALPKSKTAVSPGSPRAISATQNPVTCTLAKLAAAAKGALTGNSNPQPANPKAKGCCGGGGLSFGSGGGTAAGARLCSKPSGFNYCQCANAREQCFLQNFNYCAGVACRTPGFCAGRSCVQPQCIFCCANLVASTTAREQCFLQNFNYCAAYAPDPAGGGCFAGGCFCCCTMYAYVCEY